jgi:hypothetical protein
MPISGSVPGLELRTSTFGPLGAAQRGLVVHVVLAVDESQAIYLRDVNPPESSGPPLPTKQPAKTT